MHSSRVGHTYLRDGLLLEGGTAALALQRGGGHEALDLGALGDRLAALLDLAGVQFHGGAHVVLLREVVELADLAGALGAPHLGLVVVGKPGDILLACMPPPLAF